MCIRDSLDPVWRNIPARYNIYHIIKLGKKQPTVPQMCIRDRAGAVTAADEEKVPDGTLVDGLDNLLRMAQYGMVGKAGGDHTAAVHARDEGVLRVAAQLKRLGDDRRKMCIRDSL